MNGTNDSEYAPALRLRAGAIGLLLALSVACQSKTPTVDNGCPPDALLEEIHAAAFFYEHGSAAQARQHVLSAENELRQTRHDTVVTGLMERLRAIADQPGGEGQAKAEAEQIRATLADWRCLTEPLHAGFHERLPPLP